jgi:hypothetical protein
MLVTLGLALVAVGVVVGLRTVSARWSYEDTSTSARYGSAECGNALHPRYSSLASSDFALRPNAGYRVVEADEAIVSACRRARTTPLLEGVSLAVGGILVAIGGPLVLSLRGRRSQALGYHRG